MSTDNTEQDTTNKYDTDTDTDTSAPDPAISPAPDQDFAQDCNQDAATTEAKAGFDPDHDSSSAIADQEVREV